MGTFSEFECKCGYEATARYGFGMSAHYKEKNLSYTPALCKGCKEMVNINVNDENPHCPECQSSNVIPYSDPSLGKLHRKSVKRTKYSYRGANSGNNSAKDDIDWNLYDQVGIENYIEGVDTTVYLCPKCNQFTLEKTGGGLFD